MLTGHYAAAYALKSRVNAAPLWLLFVAVQAVDIGWGVFILTGVERVNIVPGVNASNPLDLVYMPFTHSLVATIVWAAAAFGLVTLLLKKQLGDMTQRVALAVAIGVASHWLLDLPMHLGDLPIAGGDGTKVGFGLWQNRPLSILLELALLAASIALYFRSSANELGPGARKQMAVFSGFVCAYTFLGYFGPTPTGVAMVSGFGLATYLGFAWMVRRIETAAE